MFHFSHVFKRYPGGFDALKNISFELGRGEMAFINGHSGAGKSTLLKLICLLGRAIQGGAARVAPRTRAPRPARQGTLLPRDRARRRAVAPWHRDRNGEQAA